MRPTSIQSVLLWPLRMVWQHQVNVLVVAAIGSVWFAGWTHSIDTSRSSFHLSLPPLPPVRSLAQENHQQVAPTYRFDDHQSMADVSDSGR